MGPTLAVVRVPGIAITTLSERGRLGDARANARPLGTCTQAGKGITQGDSSAHALLALTPSHRTSPANKYKPKKDSFIRSHDEV